MLAFSQCGKLANISELQVLPKEQKDQSINSIRHLFIQFQAIPPIET